MVLIHGLNSLQRNPIDNSFESEVFLPDLQLQKGEIPTLNIPEYDKDGFSVFSFNLSEVTNEELDFDGVLTRGFEEDFFFELKLIRLKIQVSNILFFT